MLTFLSVTPRERHPSLVDNFDFCVGKVKSTIENLLKKIIRESSNLRCP